MTIEYVLERKNLTKDVVIGYFNEYKNGLISLAQLSLKYNIDKRTLKDYWLNLNITNNEELLKLGDISKTKWLKEVIVPTEDELLKLNMKLLNISKYLDEIENKTTINELYNLFKLTINKNFFNFYIKDFLNSDQIKKIKFAHSSQIEIDFLNILKFYFGDDVEHSFLLDGKIFDYKLGLNLLIELDGVYWHDNETAKNNDILKNNIAKNNNYLLLRFNDKEIKNIETLNKIKLIYNETKKI